MGGGGRLLCSAETGICEMPAEDTSQAAPPARLSLPPCLSTRSGHSWAPFLEKSKPGRGGGQRRGRKGGGEGKKMGPA